VAPPGTYLDGNTAVPCADSNCYKCDASGCQVCDNRYYLKGDKCKKCPKNCISCVIADKCL
jgi:hypothetical protein